jgi:hydroxyacylglutathione hydrolase
MAMGASSRGMSRLLMGLRRFSSSASALDRRIGSTLYRQLPAYSDNYITLIVDESNGSCACVDPGDAAPVVAELKRNGWKLGAVLLTHHHDDHIGGAEELREYTGCKLIGSIRGRERLPALDEEVEGGQMGIGLLGNDEWHYSVVDTPGHTVDHIGFWFPRTETLFVGDTLFAMGCGRMFEGTPKQYTASLKRLAAFPPTSTVYCGHEYTSANAEFALSIEPSHAVQARWEAVAEARRQGLPTVPFMLGDELATNPFLRLDNPTVRNAVGARAEDGDVEVFAALRRLKDQF